MDTKKTIRRLKPYKKMLFFSVVVSLILGLAMFLLQKDKKLIVVSTLLPILSSVFQILFLEREFATLLSFSLILLAVIYYTSFQFFSKSLLTIRNLQQNRESSYNVFIILLGIVSFITILGIQYSMIVKYRIDKKEAPTGMQGRQGERGEKGNVAVNILDERTILKQAMEQYSEKVFVVALRQRNPDKMWSETTKYFTNISIKQAIPNAIDSWGFRSFMLELRKKYLDELSQVSEDDKCDTDRANQDKILKTLQHMMQQEVNAWIETFSLYENGLLYLRNPLSLEKDWETLYSKKDKENKLPASPYELLRKREIWLWNELTKEEYMKNTHTIKVSCDSLDQNCKVQRLLNKNVVFYPIVIKNSDGNYEIKITN